MEEGGHIDLNVRAGGSGGDHVAVPGIAGKDGLVPALAGSLVDDQAAASVETGAKNTSAPLLRRWSGSW